MTSFKNSKSEDRYNKSDRYLVTEQPGMFVRFVGLAVSFLVGFTVKSLLSPQRVAAKISEAASHIHQDVKVDFKSAEVSLRYSIFPRFAVVIKEIQMSSSNPCWGAPTVKIDELRLPLSLRGLFTGGSVVEVIHADHIDLHLRTDPFKCSDESQNLVVQASNSNTSPNVVMDQSDREKRYKNEIRSIFFQSIQIHSDVYPQYNSELKEFKIDVKSIEPRVIVLTAKTALLKEVKSYDPRTYTNLLLEYSEFPEPSLKAHIFGNWREGHYSLIANYTFLDSLIGVEADVKYIPLGRILDVLNQHGIAKTQAMTLRNAWLSGKLRLNSALEKIKQAPISLKDFKIEGDIGQFSSEDITLRSLSPLRLDKFTIDIRSLDVEKMWGSLKKNMDRKIFSKWGKFTGRLEVQDQKHMSLVGELRDAAMVFANKGRQELQPILNVVSEAQLEGDIAKFAVSRVELQDGTFLGDLTFKYNIKDQELKGRLNIDELIFSENIQKLLTSGGSISSVMMDADVFIKEGKLKSLSGHYALRSANLEGMSFLDNRGRFSKETGSELVVRHQSARLNVQKNSSAGNLLGSVLDDSWWGQGTAAFEKLAIELDFKNYKSFEWRKAQAQQFGMVSRIISTQGSWDDNSILSGNIKLKDKKKQTQYLLEGTRRLPQFKLIQ